MSLLNIVLFKVQKQRFFVEKLARHSGLTASIICQPCKNSTSPEKIVDILIFFFNLHVKHSKICFSILFRH